MIQKTREDSGSMERVVPESSIGGSENATTMMERVGYVTYMLSGSVAGHRNPTFDWREDTILPGVETLGHAINPLWAAR